VNLDEFMAGLYEPTPWRDRPGIAVARLRNRFRALLSAIRAAFQRARRGYSERDTYGFDHYLSRVISEGVGRLRHRAIGHPDELTMDEWDAVLAEIQVGFACASDPWEMTEADREKFKRGGALFVEYFHHLWD
jgi:hypothetical protein